MVEHLLILAGGDGTRLKEVTGTLSKPLVNMGEERVITKVIKRLVKELRIKYVYLLIQKKHYTQYIEYLKTDEIKGYPIELIVEEKKLGTGGAIKNFLNSYKVNEFYVSNADTLIKSEISKFIHSKSNSILCTKVNKNDRFGVIEVNSDHQVIAFDNTRSNKSAIVNLGIYKLQTSIFLDIEVSTFDLETTVFPKLAAKRLLNCYLVDTEFEDIGVPEAYYQELQNEKFR